MIRRLEDRLEKGKQFVYMMEELMLATEDWKNELYFIKYMEKITDNPLGSASPLGHRS